MEQTEETFTDSIYFPSIRMEGIEEFMQVGNKFKDFTQKLSSTQIKTFTTKNSNYVLPVYKIDNIEELEKLSIEFKDIIEQMKNVLITGTPFREN